MRMIVPQLTALALSFSMLATGGCRNQKPSVYTESVPAAHSLKRDNFIAAISELGKKYNYLIIADTFHASVEIKELLADKGIARAIKASGYPTLVLEAGIEENKGYEIPQIELDPEKIKTAVETIQRWMALMTPSIKVTGELDTLTRANIRGTIKGYKQGTGWRKDSTVEYTEEFDVFLRARMPPEDDINFMTPLKYLIKAGLAPNHPKTFAMDLQDLCAHKTTAEKVTADRSIAYHSNNEELRTRWGKADTEILVNSCETNTKLYYPDGRFGIAQYDEESEKLRQTIRDLMTGDAEKDQQAITEYLLKNPKMLSVSQRQLNQLVNARGINESIARNIQTGVQDGRAVIVYGAGHAKALRNLLGAHQTAIIAVLPDREYSLTLSTEDEFIPNAFYTVTADEMVFVIPGTGSEQQFRKRIKFESMPLPASEPRY